MQAELVAAEATRPPGAPDRAAVEVSLGLTAEPAAVRAALARIAGALADGAVTPDHAAATELVLAEVLNNVVEHAFAGRPPGRIRLRLRAGDGTVLCNIADDGAPLPGCRLPEGAIPRRVAPADPLPEGGFGWFLIRSLSRDLRYRRRAGRNLLCLSIPLPHGPPRR